VNACQHWLQRARRSRGPSYRLLPADITRVPRGSTQVSAYENTHMQKYSAIVNACQHELPHACQRGGHSHLLSAASPLTPCDSHIEDHTHGQRSDARDICRRQIMRRSSRRCLPRWRRRRSAALPRRRYWRCAAIILLSVVVLYMMQTFWGRPHSRESGLPPCLRPNVLSMLNVAE